MTRLPKKAWHIIGRGWNGWHAKGIDVSSSGGDLQPRPWHAGGMTTGYLEEAVEGALVYDASEADRETFARLIISGPMVDPRLAPDAGAPLDEETREAAARLAPALGGTFGRLAAAAATGRYRGLDSVGIAVYRQLLATVPGIRIGTVRDGALVWDAPAGAVGEAR